MAPGRVDFVPRDVCIGGAPEARAIDRGERAGVPDVKDVVPHICALQGLQLCARHVDLHPHHDSHSVSPGNPGLTAPTTGTPPFPDNLSSGLKSKSSGRSMWRLIS